MSSSRNQLTSKHHFVFLYSCIAFLQIDYAFSVEPSDMHDATKAQAWGPVQCGPGIAIQPLLSGYKHQASPTRNSSFGSLDPQIVLGGSRVCEEVRILRGGGHHGVAKTIANQNQTSGRARKTHRSRRWTMRTIGTRNQRRRGIFFIETAACLSHTFGSCTK